MNAKQIASLLALLRRFPLLRRRVPATVPVVRRPVVRLLLACAVLAAGSPLSAGIVGAVPGSDSVTFTVSEGGVPFDGLVGAAIPEYPANTTFAAFHPSAGFGIIDIAYKFSSTRARVIIPDTGVSAIASQGAPAPDDGEIKIRADFTIDFAIDGAGTLPITIPIEYPIAFGGPAGTADGFDVEVNYTSLALGPLGASTLSFESIGPGGSPFFIVSGPTLGLPALPAFDTLTLSGFFELTADGFPGGSTEITVFGIPEPSSLLLVGIASLGLLAVRRRHRAA